MTNTPTTREQPDGRPPLDLLALSLKAGASNLALGDQPPANQNAILIAAYRRVQEASYLDRRVTPQGRVELRSHLHHLACVCVAYMNALDVELVADANERPASTVVLLPGEAA